jgi:hypothetical protein
VTSDQRRSPLAGARYGQRALDLSRFVADPLDDVIAGVVRAAGVRSTEEREALRAGLDADDCYSLLAFAMRRAAAGIRDGSLAAAQEAVEALTLVTVSRIDYRDLSVDFPLYAIGRLGGDLAGVVASAAATSEPGTRAFFAAAAGRAASLTLNDCALIEVVSRYGLGFMETMAEPYAPRSDLTGIAVRMADAIDAAGRYEVDDLRLSSLPEVWFGRDAKPTGDIPASGCVSISASLPGGSRLEHGLLVFLAEVETARAASTLAGRAEEASTADRPRVATSDDRLLVLLIGGSTTFGQTSLETEASLRPLRDALRHELRH